MLNYLNASENSVPIIFVLAIISITIPYGFPLFGIMLVLFVALKLLTGRFKFRFNMGLLIILITIFHYILGIIWSEGVLYSRNISDLTNIASMLLIWVLLSDVKSYKILMHNIAQYISVTVFFVSVISIIKFLLYINSIQIDFFNANGTYPAGTSLTLDYNIFIFGISLGVLMSLYMIKKTTALLPVLFYFATFITGVSVIILSGSRRGWIILGFILLLLISSAFKNFLKRKANLNRIFVISIIIIYLATIILLIGIPFGMWDRLTNLNEIVRLINRFETLLGFEYFGALDSREVRWDYAKLLLSEQNLIEKIFGSGFSYLEKYAEYFNTDATEDYPHSPFYSALLYSGIIGLLSLLILLIYTSIKGIKNRSILITEFIMFYFISWIIIFISGNSIFTYKVFILLTVVILSLPKFEKFKRNKTVIL